MKLHAPTRLMSAVLLVTASFLPQTGQATDFAKLYDKISPSVVTIKTQRYEFSRSGIKIVPGIGTGVLIEPTLIITAAHVIDKADAIQVVFKDQSKIKAEPLTILEKSDVALVRLAEPHPDFVLAELGDSDATPVGSPVFVIGSPFGIEQTLSVGILSGRTQKNIKGGSSKVEFLYTDTAINPGNSGGPMFNEKGEVIGIVSFILTKSGGFEGIGFAAAINAAYSGLMSSPAYVAGVDGVALTKRQARLLNLPDKGFLVQKVIDESVTDKLGIKAGSVQSRIGEQELLLGGDIILSIECGSCEEAGSLSDARVLARQLLEPDVVLNVYREGEIVVLRSEPEPLTDYDSIMSQLQLPYPHAVAPRPKTSLPNPHSVMAGHF